MLNVLQSITDFLTMIVDSVRNLVTGIASMLSIIPQSMTVLNYAIGYMPGVLATFALAGIAICVVFHIIGR